MAYWEILALDLGHFEPIWGIMGLDLGQFTPISGVLSLDWACFGFFHDFWAWI